jgi:excisionase family DNA binding protein
MTERDNLSERLMTVKDVATAMNASTKTVRRRIEAGDLPVVRDGRLIRIRPMDFRRYLASKIWL